MAFPGAGRENVRDLVESKIALVLAVVEVGRKANAGFRPIVHQDFAGEEFAADFGSIGAIDGDCAGALGGVFRRIDAPAARARTLEDAAGKAHGLFTDGADAGLI